MFLGTLAAIAHGAALPGLMFVFGDLTDTYIYHATSRGLAEARFGGDCSDCVNCSEIIRNETIPGCGVFDVNSTVTFEEVLQSCYSSRINCLDEDDFIDEINDQILIFVGIGVGVFIFGTLQIYLYQVACERQVKKIRQEFYRAILRQEIGWFDATPSGELATRLTE